ncbi:carbohydrate ABC transporter permease [Actinospica robiniae]|uniref:carbohydrate ABC transporter permease n=1 Tax=Actinospica robiniae TaxID=304901 RepID=UPI0005576D85|nr:sugar ABC transporter permease [Actinospica robiniae]
MTTATADTGPAVPADARRSARAKRRRRRTVPFYFIVPAALLYGFVVLWSSIQGVGFAFTDWNGLDPHKNFVGLAQFTKVFHDQKALSALGHSLLLALGITVAQNLLGLLLALGVNSRIKSRNVLRVFLFAPAVVTPVAAAFVWQYLLTPNGVVNELLRSVGLGSLQQDWFGNPHIALLSIGLIVVWEFSGYSMVIFLAGLQGVPEAVIEASLVDGAGPFRRFWHVVRPELAPAITINLMLSVISSLKLFDQVQVTTGGGPGAATETLSTQIYKNVFQFNEYGYGIALAVVLTVCVALISAFQHWALNKQNESGGTR